MPIFTRRRFLGALAAVSAGATGFTRPQWAAAEASAAWAPRPCAPAAWQKLAVVLDDTEGAVQNFTCAAEPLGTGRWRIWYSQRGEKDTSHVGFAEGKPGEPLTRHLAVLSAGEPADAPLSIGNLPPGWLPTQAVHLQLQSGRHRLYFWAHGPELHRYLAAESADGRRYRVLDPLRPCLYHPHDRAVGGKAAAAAGLPRLAQKVSTSPKQERSAPARLISNDATNVYRLDDGTYEMYSVGLIEVARGDPRFIAHDNAAGWVRVIDRYVSRDGLDWTDRRRVLVPDQRDPPDLQFYYLAVTHTPRGRIGLLGHYRVAAQTTDVEFCYSADGVTWQRPARQAWLPRGKPGEPDSYGIYASHALVQDDRRWHLFYAATNTAHNRKHSHGRPATAVMHAATSAPWS